MTTLPTFVDDVTCLGCGCACDDIRIGVRDGRIVGTGNACTLGVQWFGDGTVPTRSILDGNDVPLPIAIATAASRLLEATRPLVYLAPGVSCETQRTGAALADLLCARLDSVTSATTSPLVLAAQERGFASATLGEVRNRADLVVFWGVDVDRRYPRFTSRYAPGPVGTHVPAGRGGRHVIAVDVGAATTVEDADRRFAIAPANELSTLTAIAALVREPVRGTVELRPMSSPAWEHAHALAPLLIEARYVAVVYDGEPDDRDGRSPQRFDALVRLSHALNDRTRCAGIALRGGGNRSGADSVLAAHTGFPIAVDFARGFPQYRPHDGCALAVLDDERVDVVCVIGDASLIPGPVRDGLAAIRAIVIGPRASTAPLGAAVVIDTGVAGIHSVGTAFRTDDVPLPLRAPVGGVRSAEAVVSELAHAVASAHRNAGTEPAVAR